MQKTDAYLGVGPQQINTCQHASESLIAAQLFSASQLSQINPAYDLAEW